MGENACFTSARTRRDRWGKGRRVLLPHAALAVRWWCACSLRLTARRLSGEDLRNNSAWNQRYFVLQQTADLSSPELIAAEVRRWRHVVCRRTLRGAWCVFTIRGCVVRGAWLASR